MADYPDWVMKHKKKGTYINCVNGKYYLYKAHSERIPGTKKVNRVFDGYIGRITEAEGLIPVRDKVTDDVIVYEYGLCITMMTLCDNIAKGLNREFRSATDRILVAGLLTAAYGDCSQEVYEWSYLSVRFPECDMTKTLTDKQHVGAQRCMRMASDIMLKHFGEEKDTVAIKLSKIYMVKINERFYLAKISDDTKELLSKYNIDWSDWYGKGNED
jgi:hypothetical protein